jgi:hypothetical protein
MPKRSKKINKVVPEKPTRESVGFREKLRNTGIGTECGEYIQVECNTETHV